MYNSETRGLHLDVKHDPLAFPAPLLEHQKRTHVPVPVEVSSKDHLKEALEAALREVPHAPDAELHREFLRSHRHLPGQ